MDNEKQRWLERIGRALADLKKHSIVAGSAASSPPRDDERRSDRVSLTSK